jgi:hypothetical protein
MNSFDFDVISDAPPPRVIKPADKPKAETPSMKELTGPKDDVPQSDAA